MLSRANFGLHLTGRIDAISDVKHSQGTTAKGSSYSFYQQTASVSIGGTMFEVVARADSPPSGNLIHFELDQVVRLKVQNPRIFNGKVSFDIA